MTKSLKKISIFLMVLITMVSISSSFTYATDTNTFNNGNLTVVPVNDSEYLLSCDGSSATMKLIREDEKFIVKVDSSENQEDGCFVVDMNKGTLYSSYTGKVINKSELISEADKNIRTRSVVATTPKKISYKKIAEVVSDISDQYTIAGAIIAITALVMGVSIATGPSAVVALIGVGFLVISNGLESKSPNHGVIVYVNKNKVEKHQAGQVFTSYTYTIGKVGTY